MTDTGNQPATLQHGPQNGRLGPQNQVVAPVQPVTNPVLLGVRIIPLPPVYRRPTLGQERNRHLLRGPLPLLPAVNAIVISGSLDQHYLVFERHPRNNPNYLNQQNQTQGGISGYHGGGTMPLPDETDALVVSNRSEEHFKL